MTEPLRVGELRKEFGRSGRGGAAAAVVAVDDVSFFVSAGSLFTLLGPSGCGKTTTLRCIAGLEAPTSGKIELGDRVLYSSAEGLRIAANQRGLGMVFQSYAIWPHMNVQKNVSFPLESLPRGKRPGKREIRRRVEEVLTVVQLDGLADRPAPALSGGQQQRLALARALVMEPPLLLLDEPLSNLDAKLRERMRFELKSLQRRVGITAIYVTHDQTEALTMSDAIAVMNGGRLEQVGSPREVYDEPVSSFVADFIGNSNLIDGTVESTRGAGREGGPRYGVKTEGGYLEGEPASSDGQLAVGAKVVVTIRPERVDIRPADEAGDAVNQWRGEVMMRAFAGDSVEHLLSCGPVELRARGQRNVSFDPGSEVAVSVPPEDVRIIPTG